MPLDLPRDPRLSIDPNYQGLVTKKEEDALSSNSPPSTKDTLDSICSTDLISSLFSEELTHPQLNIPQSSDHSIAGSFKDWIEAMRTFRNQLSASEKTDLESRSKLSQLTVMQAQELSKIMAEKAKLIAQLQEEIKNKLNDLRKDLDKMEELAKEQQKKIDEINAGNGVEKEQYENLARAYDDYIAKMKEIGIADQGNGHFLIPEEPEEIKNQYNQLTKEYQRKVSVFNDYWKKRSDQIQKYNVTTASYNQQVAEHNKVILEFVNQNRLFDYFNQQGISIPQLTSANRRDLSNYQNIIETPSMVIQVPASIFIYSLPAYIRSIAQAGPSGLARPTPVQFFDTEKLHPILYQREYEKQILPFDQSIIQYTSYWSFLMREKIQNLDKDLSDSRMNAKVLATKLLLSNSTEMRKESVSSYSFMMQTLGTGNSHMQAMLGRILLKETIAHAELKALEEYELQEKQTKIDQLTDHILLLSIGLLGNQSLQALLPSLGILSDHLASLPKDSPAFAILFAVSFMNRIQEDIQQGTTSQALQTFLNSDPFLASLSDSDKVKLAAALHLGHLLVAGKLLEETLGLPGLLAKITPFLSPVLDDRLTDQAEQETGLEYRELEKNTKTHFLNQGYSDDKAQFLAQTAVDLTQAGLLTPTLTSSISSKTFNQPLLENSIKAALVLEGYSLNEATQITNEAINQTLLDAPYSSPRQFRASLELHLSDLQVKNSPEIALSAILTAPIKTLLKQNTNSPSFTLPNASLSSPGELMGIVEKHTLALLTPQLGSLLSKEISQEIAKSVFGHVSPQSTDVDRVNVPYAWVNIMQDQIDHLKIEQNTDWMNALTATFKESIKTMESFYAFSLKLMDPAYLFIFACGIIYGHPEGKKSIDIPI